MEQHRQTCFLVSIVVLVVLGGMLSCTRHRCTDISHSWETELDALYYYADPQAAEQKWDSLMKVVPDSFCYYKGVIFCAKQAFRIGNSKRSIALLDSVDRFCHRREGDAQTFVLIADVANMRGNLYGQSAQIDSMISSFQKAYHYLSMIKTTGNKVNVCLNLADAYVRHGRYDQGAYWYRYSLLLADSLALPDSHRFPAYYGLAQVEMELRDFAMCDYYYDLAYQYYDCMQPYEKHIYLNNRGNSYYFREDYPKALEYFRRSMALVGQYPEMAFEQNLTMINMGEVFLLMNEIDSASYYLNRCYGFFHQNENVSALYYIDTQLIELALKQGQVDRAARYIEQSVTPEFVEPNMLNIRNRYLEHYYAEIGDYRKAYHYQAENRKINDSIRNERIGMRVKEISMRYKQDSTLMKKEILIQQQENEVLRLNQLAYILGGSALLIAAVMLAIVLYRKRRSDRAQWSFQRTLAGLRLENARNRIFPHFIFNVLNREMVHRSGEEGQTKLTGLVKLIRRNLELTGKQAVSIAEELDFVDTYIALEQEGLGKTFRYIRQIDAALPIERLQIPAMLIQIPVENAIKHGLREKEGSKKLWIEIQPKDADTFLIIIRDNGGGYRSKSTNRGTGTGMKVITQTIQMLNACNKQPIVLTVSNVPLDDDEMGCEIRFSIPIHYSYQLN